MVGIYLQPSFSITRALGGVAYALYMRRNGSDSGNVVLVASGLVIGEAITSFLSVALTALHATT